MRPDNTEHDGEYEIPTFQEVIDLAARLGVGIYPETKHPAYHRSIGLPLEPRLIDALQDVAIPVFVQSFEAENLRALPRPLVQLLGKGPIDVAAIAGYAQAVGPAKQLVDAELVAAAHAAGLGCTRTRSGASRASCATATPTSPPSCGTSSRWGSTACSRTIRTSRWRRVVAAW